MSPVDLSWATQGLHCHSRKACDPGKLLLLQQKDCSSRHTRGLMTPCLVLEAWEVTGIEVRAKAPWTAQQTAGGQGVTGTALLHGSDHASF